MIAVREAPNGEQTRGCSMTVQEAISQVRDAVTVKRVFAEPYEKDGVVVIPAAAVRGGGGGGEGPDGTSASGGGGFGVSAHPAGAFVIKNGDVSWQQAVDRDRDLSTMAVVAVAGMFTLRSIVRARARRARKARA